MCVKCQGKTTLGHTLSIRYQPRYNYQYHCIRTKHQRRPAWSAWWISMPWPLSCRVFYNLGFIHFTFTLWFRLMTSILQEQKLSVLLLASHNPSFHLKLADICIVILPSYWSSAWYFQGSIHHQECILFIYYMTWIEIPKPATGGQHLCASNTDRIDIVSFSHYIIDDHWPGGCRIVAHLEIKLTVDSVTFVTGTDHNPKHQPEYSD